MHFLHQVAQKTPLANLLVSHSTMRREFSSGAMRMQKEETVSIHSSMQLPHQPLETVVLQQVAYLGVLPIQGPDLDRVARVAQHQAVLEARPQHPAVAMIMMMPKPQEEAAGRHGVTRGLQRLHRVKDGVLLRVSSLILYQDCVLTYSKERADEQQNLPYCEDINGGFTSLSPSGFGSQTKMITAHAALAALAMVIFFPVGSIAIRLASFTGVVWFHAALQILGYIIYIAAFGIGIYIANSRRMVCLSKAD